MCEENQLDKGGERMAREETVFSLPRASYGRLLAIIGGYLHAGADKEGVRLAQVVQATGIGRERISENNKFLTSLGIVEKVPEGIKLTGDGRNLALALSYDEESEDVRRLWRKLVAQNDFLRRVVGAVTVRKVMAEDAFAEHIARATGVPKKAWSMAGARAVTEILVRSGVLERDNGNVKLAEGLEGVEWAELARMPPAAVAARKPPAEEVGPPLGRVAEIGRAQVQLNLSISLPHDLTEDQAVALAKSLKRFFVSLEESDAQEEQA